MKYMGSLRKNINHRFYYESEELHKISYKRYEVLYEYMSIYICKIKRSNIY
jgi:hypothetical protein